MLRDAGRQVVETLDFPTITGTQADLEKIGSWQLRRGRVVLTTPKDYVSRVLGPFHSVLPIPLIIEFEPPGVV